MEQKHVPSVKIFVSASGPLREEFLGGSMELHIPMIFWESDSTAYYGLCMNTWTLLSSLILRRLNWTGHMNRMKGKAKQILKSQPEDVTRTGRPRCRWCECVWTDIKEWRNTSWRKTSRNMNEWKETFKEAMVHFGQYDELRRRGIKSTCLHLRWRYISFSLSWNFVTDLPLLLKQNCSVHTHTHTHTQTHTRTHTHSCKAVLEHLAMQFTVLASFGILFLFTLLENFHCSHLRWLKLCDIGSACPCINDTWQRMKSDTMFLTRLLVSLRTTVFHDNETSLHGFIFSGRTFCWFHHTPRYEITWLKTLNVPIVSLRKCQLTSVTLDFLTNKNKPKLLLITGRATNF